MPERFKLVSAVYLHLERDGRILLQRRANTGYMDGFYSMIAGHKDEGETLRQAMIREAQEEAGIIVQPEHLQLVHIMHRRQLWPDRTPQEERYDFFFTASAWEGEPTIREPEKCDHLDWFATDALPGNTVPYLLEFFDHYKNSRLYGEVGW